jgi:hypothetical protein
MENGENGVIKLAKYINENKERKPVAAVSIAGVA